MYTQTITTNSKWNTFSSKVYLVDSAAVARITNYDVILEMSIEFFSTSKKHTHTHSTDKCFTCILARIQFTGVLMLIHIRHSFYPAFRCCYFLLNFALVLLYAFSCAYKRFGCFDSIVVDVPTDSKP